MAARSNPYAGRSRVSTGNISETRSLLNIQVDAPGLDAMIERLQRFARIGDTDAKRVRAGMRQVVKLVLGEAKKTVPVSTGNLRGSLFSRVKIFSDGNVAGRVGSSWTMPRAIIPFTLEGGRRANRRGRMAITPRRWLYRAYKNMAQAIDAIWKNVLEQITRDLSGR